MFGNIVSAISGASTALNAYNNKKAAKKIASENRKIAEMQFEYNKKEISRAFGENLKAILREQANDRIGAVEEARTMLSNINMATGNNANVESESFEHDVKDKTSKDIADSMVFMLDTHKMGLEDLTNTRVAQTYNLGLNYANALSSINNKEIALKQYYNQQMAAGIMKMTASVGDMMMDSTEESSSSKDNVSATGSDFNYNQYDSNYFSNSILDFGSYNPHKKNYGF